VSKRFVGRFKKDRRERIFKEVLSEFSFAGEEFFLRKLAGEKLNKINDDRYQIISTWIKFEEDLYKGNLNC